MNKFNCKLLHGKHHLHFVGIGGSGMFPLVQLLHEAGFHISGSDAGTGDIVNRERAMGISVASLHRAENVHGADLVIYSAAIDPQNPELTQAKALGIACVERSVLLGAVAAAYPHAVCIAGTHGKTTTTAMTTQIMLSHKADTAAVIGGKLPLIDAYGRFGRGDAIIVEACEYHNTFLELTPYAAVLLNIDADHLEFFKSMDGLKAAFRAFLLRAQHCIIANVDDANTREVIADLDKPVITFGINKPADVQAMHIQEYRPSFFCFDLYHNGTFAVHIQLSVPGQHQIYNALAAFASACLFDCPAEICAQALHHFRGAGRRFELLGECRGITIADDYAHHPAELKTTLESALKMNYRSVWAVFQPFTYSRTQLLLNDFAQVLRTADHVVLTEIMGGRERPENYTVTTAQLADQIPGSVWFHTFEEVCNYVMKNAQPGDLVITLGCGDIYKAAKMMLCEQ